MGKENMEITYEQAINCNKNLKEFMRITDKTSKYKFLEDNYIALDMAIQALDVWNKMFKSYEALTAKIESEDDISHATERIDKWCIEQLRGIISDYYADRIINKYTTLEEVKKTKNKEEILKYRTKCAKNAIKEYREQMRDATPEENEAVDKYIKSISKPTGVNIFDFYEDEEQDNKEQYEKIDCEKTDCKNCINHNYCDYEQLPSITISQEHDGCKDCKYEDYPEYYYPCCDCKQNYIDKWERAKHWIHRNDDYTDWLECPNCGYGSEGEVKYGEGTPYCPYCGERLKNEN